MKGELAARSLRHEAETGSRRLGEARGRASAICSLRRREEICGATLHVLHKVIGGLRSLRCGRAPLDPRLVAVRGAKLLLLLLRLLLLQPRLVARLLRRLVLGVRSSSGKRVGSIGGREAERIFWIGPRCHGGRGTCRVNPF